MRERGRQSALDNMIYKQRQNKPKSQFSSPAPKKRSASATFTPTSTTSSSPAPKKAKASTPAKSGGGAVPSQKQLDEAAGASTEQVTPYRGIGGSFAQTLPVSPISVR